jgi:hypothetical protein
MTDWSLLFSGKNKETGVAPSEFKSRACNTTWSCFWRITLHASLHQQNMDYITSILPNLF